MTGSFDEFVWRRNIAHYQSMLASETDETKRRTLGRLLIEAERAHALASAAQGGVGHSVRKLPGALHRLLFSFREDIRRSDRACLLLDPGPGLPILDASEAYARLTLTNRAALIGRHLFEVFPDNPDDIRADRSPIFMRRFGRRPRRVSRIRCPSSATIFRTSWAASSNATGVRSIRRYWTMRVMSWPSCTKSTT